MQETNQVTTAPDNDGPSTTYPDSNILWPAVIRLNATLSDPNPRVSQNAAAAADRRAGSGADAERGPGRDHRVVRPARRDRGAGCGCQPGQAAGSRFRGRRADHSGAGAGVHDRGGAGPPAYSGAVAGGGGRAGGPVTIDLDTTDVEVYGRKKRGVAYNHQGQRVGRPHVATWAGRVALRADAGYFAGSWPAPPTRRASACAAVCAAVVAAVMASRDVTAWHGRPRPVTSGRGGPGRLVRRCR